MRRIFAGLLGLGLAASALVAQVAPPEQVTPQPKPSATPSPSTQPAANPLAASALGQPPKPGTTPPGKVVKKENLISFTSFGSEQSREQWKALDDDDRIAIKDITVREFFERIQAIGFFGTFVIKESLKDEKMPETILAKSTMADFIYSLDMIADDFEINNVDNNKSPEGIFVVSAKPKPQGKSNILFLPVHLEPLLERIQGSNEKETMERKFEKIKSIQIVIKEGIELDNEARGVKPVAPLKMMVHHATNLLFLAGPTEQVEVASKILSALGARMPTQEMMGGGWRGRSASPGMESGGMGGPMFGGPGMGSGAMGFGAMGGPKMGGPGGGMGMPGSGGSGMGAAGVPHATKPHPPVSVQSGGGGASQSGISPLKP